MRHIVLIVALAGLAPNQALSAGGHDEAEAPAVVRTGKERLRDKAADEQRVDDCKVPPAQRTRVRPTDCRFQ